MPVISTPELPTSIDPKNASVFDPLYKTLLRKATSLAGLDDPQSMIMQSVAPSPLIAKIPFDLVGPRNASLLELAKKKFSPEFQQVVEYASKEYPRILAHVQELGETDLGKYGYGINQNSQAVPGLTDIILSPKTIAKYPQQLPFNKLGDTAETFGHELTHTAQKIWNGKNFGDMYDAANTWGGKDTYWPNVFESGARKAGTNFRTKVAEAFPEAYKASQAKPGIISKLMDVFSKEPAGTEGGVASKISNNPSFRRPTLMKAGGNVYKNINGHYVLLNEAEKTSALNGIKPFEAPIVAKGPAEVPVATPTTLSPIRTPPPAPSGKWNQAVVNSQSMSRSKLNTSMVQNIRQQIAKGVSFEEIARQYDFVPRESLRAVVKGDSWPGIK